MTALDITGTVDQAKLREVADNSLELCLVTLTGTVEKPTVVIADGRYGGKSVEVAFYEGDSQ